MRVKKGHVAALLIAAVGFVAWFARPGDSSAPPEAPPQGVGLAEPGIELALPRRHVDEPETGMQQPRVLMKPGSREAAKDAFRGLLTDKVLSDGRLFIEFDTQGAQQLGVGHMFEVLLPGQPHPAVAKVDDFTTFEGMHRLAGSFVGTDETSASFSMTISSDGSYAAANFEFPSRGYVLESKDGAGWVNSAGNEAKHLKEAEILLQ